MMTTTLLFIGVRSRPATLKHFSIVLGTDQMLLFIAAIFLVAAGSVTIPSVSLLCLGAGLGSIILEALI